MLGLRAEHLTDQGESSEAAVQFEAVVDVVEPAGSDTFVVTRFADSDFVARMRGDAMVAPGDRVTLNFDIQRLHFFDPVSEQRVVA